MDDCPNNKRSACSGDTNYRCTQARGQCFYIQIIKERSKKSEFSIDRLHLAKSLGESFEKKSEELHLLELNKGDLLSDACYKTTLSGMIILSRDHDVDWGVSLPGI